MAWRPPTAWSFREAREIVAICTASVLVTDSVLVTPPLAAQQLAQG
jgi:hypothetical protein